MDVSIFFRRRGFVIALISSIHDIRMFLDNFCAFHSSGFVPIIFFAYVNLTFFIRRILDIPCFSRVLIPKPRSKSRRYQSAGIFPGAKVIRGGDWIWGDQDGGGDGVGTVSEIR